MEKTVIDIVDILIALLTGSLLGAFYFGGLWWTVRKLISTEYPSSLFLLSVLFRTSFVVVGFYLILGDNWQRLIAGLLGFMLVRILATWHIRQTEQSKASDQETDYAP
jgi:F1F0 ATPase subunit 2